MTYQFIKEFENNYKTIYNEYLTIKNNVYPWPEPELHGGGWDVFGLYLGSEYDYVTKQTTAQLDMNNCPFTRKLIKDNIPEYGSAGFSILKKNSTIIPHKGVKNKYLRMHLGLKVPEIGDLGLYVESYGIFQWEESKAFYFDDSKLHRAWNNTNEDRIVFMIDFDPSTVELR